LPKRFGGRAGARSRYRAGVELLQVTGVCCFVSRKASHLTAGDKTPWGRGGRALLGSLGSLRSVDLAGPSSNNLSAGSGARQSRPRRGDRPRDRPRDDRRGARADGTGRAETARAVRPLRRPLALPLSRGARAGDTRRCGAPRLKPAISRHPKHHPSALASLRTAAQEGWPRRALTAADAG
jgi:hypothetical protein